MDDSVAEEAVARRYERVVEAMGDGVYVLDADARYVDVNEYLAELSGYDVDEMVGARPSKLHSESDVARFERAIRDLLARDDPGVETVEADLTTADGAAIPIEVNLTLLPREDGEFRGTVGVVRDVTDRKERERELERYETLLELMPDTVAVADMDGIHVELHGFEGWLGYEREEIVGEPLEKTMTEEGIERASAVVEELLSDDEREKATFEHELISKDGGRIPIESHLTLLPGDEEGQFAGTMSVLRDVTERKERERELERQNERLEEFADVVSHDLRNPLNVAMGRLELLAETEADHVEEIGEALERIDAIVEDVLALAREGETVEDPRPFSLSALAGAAWDTVRTREGGLAVEDDPKVVADATRLQRLFENLFRNALEHGDEAVGVRVGTFESETDRGPSPGFYVADDGPGIPPDDRETVFESGYTTADRGTGLGLAIVQRIAEAHGWSVSVAEGRDGGARFEFTGVEFADAGRD